ncbi:hypothetical protein [Streptomyces cathayae]|uniref:Secreted protein n=1 Tax=Streptomyces cathayae TaxID=3031124 RepID=A0ABY8JUY4_9ACTN|nr:hypothetical protein [Streptomyces sp. HUAS 5]WGD39795.1 hypothetical protein PYS65_06435 [Streptomyces sp. HUAS 5]
MRAAPMGGLVHGKHCLVAAVTITSPASKVLRPLSAHRSRKHSKQMTAQHRDNQLETAARPHTWRYRRAQHSALHHRVPAHG